jgi:hypothetical protein
VNMCIVIFYEISGIFSPKFTEMKITSRVNFFFFNKN